MTGSALQHGRQLVDDLFSLVPRGRMYDRPIPLRHRLAFYLGHVDAFDWNLIVDSVPNCRHEHPEYDRLFAFGIDPDASGAPTDTPSDWPEIGRIEEYCRTLRDRVDELWQELPEQRQHVAIEHRLMHAETLAYQIHAMELNGGSPAADTDASAPRNEAIRIPAGSATLGRSSQDGFGWDNEFPRIQCDVPEFAIDRYPVTNGEYEQFVEAGGPVPHFWRGEHGCRRLRGAFGEYPLPRAWPVYVTYQQARAYAEWRGASLPSEAQWHRAAYGTPWGEERSYPWGEADPSGVAGNFDNRAWDPEAIGSQPGTASAFGVEDLMGNGWEWTSTPFAPFPGFEPFSFYRGYSADFFDGVHFVLKGGSPRTDAVFLRRSFRNWFRRDYPYVFATFRCVS